MRPPLAAFGRLLNALPLSSTLPPPSTERCYFFPRTVCVREVPGLKGSLIHSSSKARDWLRYAGKIWGGFLCSKSCMVENTHTHTHTHTHALVLNDDRLSVRQECFVSSRKLKTYVGGMFHRMWVRKIVLK